MVAPISSKLLKHPLLEADEQIDETTADQPAEVLENQPPDADQVAGIRWANERIARAIASGKLDPSQESGQRQRCSTCKGSSLVMGDDGFEHKCSECKYGWVDATEDQRCPTCLDAGFIRDNTAEYANPEHVVACPTCTDDGARRLAALRIAKVPQKYRGFTLAGWIQNRAEVLGADGHDHKAIELASSLITRRLESEEGHTGAMFWGQTGVGKSGLAAGIVREMCLSYRTRWIAWNTYPDEISEMRTASERFNDRIAEDGRAELLIIDDLGVETETSGFRLRLLNDLLERRDSRPTIITSMFGIGDIRERYGEYNAGRIFEMCAMHEIDGENLRTALNFRR